MEPIGIGTLAKRAGVGKEVRELLALSARRDVAKVRRAAQTKLAAATRRIRSRRQRHLRLMA
jgi:hypothetical protein